MYSLTFSLGIALTILIISRFLKLELKLIFIPTVIGMCLFYSLIMGFFGSLYASPLTISIEPKNIDNTLQNISSSLKKAKYEKIESSNQQIVFSTNKFSEWFYGKVFININNDRITISASRYLIDKYLKNY